MEEKRFVCAVVYVSWHFPAASHIFGIVILFYFCLLCQVRVSDVSQGDWGQSQGQDQRSHRQTRLGSRFSGLKVTMKRILRDKYNFSF